MSTNFWLELDGQTFHIGKANHGSAFVWQGYVLADGPRGQRLGGPGSWTEFLGGLIRPFRITDDCGAEFTEFELLDRVKAMRKLNPGVAPRTGEYLVGCDYVRYGEWE